MAQSSKIKDILIIRSTHLEHLDLVLKRIKETFGEVKVSILTHPYAVRALDNDFITVIPYNIKGDFSIFNIRTLRNIKEIRKGFDLVVVPFNNESGAGYFNVILFAFGIRSNLRMVCNRNGQLMRIGYGYLVRSLSRVLLSSFFAIIATIIFALPIVLFSEYRIIKSLKK